MLLPVSSDGYEDIQNIRYVYVRVCVYIYILCIDDDTYMYIGQTMLAGDGMEMKPRKSTRHNLCDNTSHENAMSIRSKRQFPVCRMCFHLSQQTI
jgi:hypothetical protein